MQIWANLSSSYRWKNSHLITTLKNGIQFAYDTVHKLYFYQIVRQL
jgi:hypothetical protein